MKIFRFDIFLLVVVLLLVVGATSPAQIPPTAWLKVPGGIYIDYGVAVAVDRENNMYAIGRANVEEFDGIQPKSGTGIDFYVAKYDVQGVIQWVQAINGYDYQTRVNAICVDDSGNVYVGGQFYYILRFGSEDALGSSGSATDLFIVKYDRNGVVQWTHNEYASGHESVTGIASVPNGGIAVVGYMQGSDLFGVESEDSRGIFVASYDGGGKLLWSQRSSKAFGTYQANAVAVDKSSNVYAVGHVKGTLANVPLDGSGAVLFKFDATGTLIMRSQATGEGQSWGHALALDPSGNVYVIGQTSGGVTFGEFTTDTLTRNSTYLAKYSTDGEVLWLRTGIGGSQHNDERNAIVLSATGDVYVGGQIEGTMKFSTTTVTSAGKTDGFVARYTADGDLVWIDQLGGQEDDDVRGVAVDRAGGLYATGKISGTALVGGRNVVSNGAADAYILKYGLRVSGLRESYGMLSSSILPNPSLGIVTFTSSLLRGPIPAVVEVLDARGERVLREEVPPGPTHTLDLSESPPGIYFVRIVAGLRSEHQALIIAR